MMQDAQTSTNDGSAGRREDERLTALAATGLLDTPPESRFDSIVQLARVLFDTPISAITLVDRDRQWFKAQAGLDATETAREQSFCSHAMAHGSTFVVPDASQDPRFAAFPNVVGAPHIRFYAGAPLRTADGQNLGALCVISSDPRGDFPEEDRRKLEILANIVGNEIELKTRAKNAHKMVYEKDLALREAHFRIKNSLEYATLLAEVQSSDTTTDQLSALAMVAWKQYTEAGGILNASIKSLRNRMGRAEYMKLLDMMPGFVM